MPKQPKKYYWCGHEVPRLLLPQLRKDALLMFRHEHGMPIRVARHFVKARTEKGWTPKTENKVIAKYNKQVEDRGKAMKRKRIQELRKRKKKTTPRRKGHVK
jgi:hypothetical protein